MKYSWLKNSPICYKGLFDNNEIVENSIPAITKAVDGGYNLFLNLSMTKIKSHQQTNQIQIMMQH